MSTHLFEVNQQRLRKDELRLARLAAFGELALLLGLIATPIVLFAIQLATVPTENLLSFLRRAYLSDATAQPNLYGVLKGLLALLVLDRTRQLGNALSAAEPLGSHVATHLRGLMAAMVAAILAMCFSVEMTQHAFNNTFQTNWTWSLTPLYLGVIVLLGLSIVERIVRHADLLDAEVQEFV